MHTKFTPFGFIYYNKAQFSTFKLKQIIIILQCIQCDSQNDLHLPKPTINTKHYLLKKFHMRSFFQFKYLCENIFINDKT